MTEPLTKFVATDDDPREYLREPFRVDHYAVGTDGHSLLFRELRDEDEWGEFDELPDSKKNIENSVRKFIADALDVTEWRESFYFDRPPKEKLTAREKCDECNGDGSVYWSTCQNDYEAECQSCDGIGSTRAAYIPVEILGKSFNFRLVSRFVDAKKLRVSMVDTNENNYGRLFFQFGEFGEYKGLILGLRE